MISKLPGTLKLKKLGHDYWEFLLKVSPRSATFLGDPRYNDRLEELGPVARQKQVAKHKAFLKRLKKIKLNNLSSNKDKITYRILDLKLQEFLESQKFKEWEWSLDQLSGPQMSFMQLIEIHPLKTKNNYDDLIKRFRKIPKYFEQYLEDLRDGLKSGRVAPYVAYDRVLDQLQKFLQLNPIETKFAEPLKNFPKSFSQKDRKKYVTLFEKLIRTHIVPSYQKFLTFLKTEYKDRSRKEVGISAIPNGRENYAFLIRYYTTTDKTPEELHQLGLDELQKNKEEILAVARTLGHTGNLKSFLEKIKSDRSNYYERAEELIQGHNIALKRVEKLLPKYFGVLPTIPFEIKEMDKIRAASAPAAYYYPPAEDRSRPGIFWMNTLKPEEWANYSMETLAFHEAIPGHHLQIAIATEQKGIPKFQKHGGFTAYIEGWAHYTERLADEMGAYSSPLQRVGMLLDQAWRAIRLVVDTGIHYFGWSREKTLEFMKETRVANEMEMNNEIDRYIVWPGQALAYKVGQRAIYDLREWAKAELGSKFDIRKFHDVVLLSMPLPLVILKEIIQEWVTQQRK